MASVMRASMIPVFLFSTALFLHCVFNGTCLFISADSLVLVFSVFCWDDSDRRVGVGFKTGSTLGGLGCWRSSLFLCPRRGFFLDEKIALAFQHMNNGLCQC